MPKAFIVNLPNEVRGAQKANHYLEALGRIQIHLSFSSRKLLVKKYPEFESTFLSKKTEDYLIFELLFLGGFITKDEYVKLERFRHKRNEFIHELTAINQYNSSEVNELIDFGLLLFEQLDKKLRI